MRDGGLVSNVIIAGLFGGRSKSIEVFTTSIDCERLSQL